MAHGPTAVLLVLVLLLVLLVLANRPAICFIKNVCYIGTNQNVYGSLIEDR
jgi:hypothetical protein